MEHVETKISPFHQTKSLGVQELQRCYHLQCGLSKLSILEYPPCILQVTASFFLFFPFYYMLEVPISYTAVSGSRFLLIEFYLMRDREHTCLLYCTMHLSETNLEPLSQNVYILTKWTDQASEFHPNRAMPSCISFSSICI